MAQSHRVSLPLGISSPSWNGPPLALVLRAPPRMAAIVCVVLGEYCKPRPHPRQLANDIGFGCLSSTHPRRTWSIDAMIGARMCRRYEWLLQAVLQACLFAKQRGHAGNRMLTIKHVKVSMRANWIAASVCGSKRTVLVRAARLVPVRSDVS